MKLKRSVAWKHGTRVRLGSRTGPRGVLLQFEKVNTDTGELETFWRVRLQGTSAPGSRWRPAVDLIVDGPGTHVADACLECGLPYLTESLSPSVEYLCAHCAAAAYGPTSRNFPQPGEIDLTEPRRRRR